MTFVGGVPGGGREPFFTSIFDFDPPGTHRTKENASKSSKNPKKTGLERPEDRILMIWEVIMASQNHQISRPSKTSYFEGSIVRKHLPF